MKSGQKFATRTIASVAGAVVLLGAGWLAALVFVSPDQRAADAQAPDPSVLTAVVVREDLIQTTSGTARVEARQRIDLVVPQQGPVSIVTSQPVSEGSSVTECTAVLEVNGRPLIAVVGDFAFYRDLVQGDKGPDVRQLQTALNHCGHDLAVDGIFGSATAGAVESLYASLGYDSPTDKSPVLSEFVVVPELPVVLEGLPAVGEAVSEETVLSVGSGPLVILAEVPDSVARADLDSIGARVSFGDDEREATLITVRAASTGESPAVVELHLVDGAVPAEWASTGGVAIFHLATAATDSLVVPTSAVVSAGLDSQIVYRAVEDGTFVAVPVREIGSLNGRTAIEAIDGNLTEGDLVLVSGP